MDSNSKIASQVVVGWKYVRGGRAPPTEMNINFSNLKGYYSI